MKLKKLFKNFPEAVIKGSKETEITGLTSHSKLVAPGNLFIARRGLSHDGNHFISEALAGGASTILTDIYDPFIKNTVQIIHPNIAQIEGKLAELFFQSPSKELFLTGITGTNGKTTTAYLLKHTLDSLNERAGLISTIEYIVGDNHFPATRTTPDIVTNNKMLRDMIRHDCKSAVMEVSSHALDQNRVQELEFDVAIFTNLTQDHLDYHPNMEWYAEAKAKLFKSLNNNKNSLAVVNTDSPWSLTMIQELTAEIMTYGLKPGVDLLATPVSMSIDKSVFDVSYQGVTKRFSWSLIGIHNIYNALAAIGCGLHKGATLEQLQEILPLFTPIPGRLEPVPNDLGIHIFVDYAHTPNALHNVLECLQAIKKKKLITLFGCGGNRDKTKRPLMGEIAEHFSDLTIITSDNPRNEPAELICEEIIEGVRQKNSCYIELDRKKAISTAIANAKPGDVVLIAGKGHEMYQEQSHQTVPFSDVEIAKEICALKNQNRPVATI